MASPDIDAVAEETVVNSKGMNNGEKSADNSRRKRRMPAIMLSLCTVSFLAAFDNMVISSNTPLAAAEFNGFQLYSWVNTAFLLTASTAQPLYGKYVNVFGRRACLALATSSYIVGATLCGAAQSMVMFIVSRAFCGLGVGAFDSLMKIVIADNIPVRYIGTYQALLGVSWGLGYITGALLGGVAVSRTDWRTVFWMGLGCAVVPIILVLYAIRDGHDGWHLFKQQLDRTDIFGIVCWCIAIISFVLAFSWAGTTYAWNSPVIITLLCVAVALFVVFGAWERWQAVEPIIPRGVMSNRSSVLILIAAFLYGGTFQSLMTYVPLYLSVIRKEESMATNLELLSLVFFACIANVMTGLIIVRTGHYRWAIRGSLGLLVLASGLLQLLDTESSRGIIVGLMIITGIASGGMINSSIVTAQASVAIDHVPAIISLMTLADLSGGITGITIQGTILNNALATNLQRLPLTDVSADQVRQSSSYLWSLPEPTRSIVMEAYMDAIHKSFWGSTGFVAAAFLASLGLKRYTMRTHT